MEYQNDHADQIIWLSPYLPYFRRALVLGTVAALRDFVTSNQLTALSELVGKRINFIKRDGEWAVLRWPPWANAEEVERGTVGSYTATSLTIKEDLMPTRRRWVRDRFNPSGGQAYELIVRDGATPTRVQQRFSVPQHDAPRLLRTYFYLPWLRTLP